MFKGFRDFILRGNVVDLAVAVIIGAAFGAITSSITADVITPLISAIVGSPDFSSLVIHVPVLHPVPPPHPLPANYIAPGEIHIGKLLNAAINFLLVSAAIYFAIVMPMHYMLRRLSPDMPPSAPTTKICPECLSEIPIAAKRCSHCTQPVAAVVSPAP
ncbi:MAG TPA: large conductance mechanosensitive channel protein MscL [Terracidiphilus sp.]